MATSAASQPTNQLVDKPMSQPTSQGIDSGFIAIGYPLVSGGKTGRRWTGPVSGSVGRSVGREAGGLGGEQLAG